MFSQFIILILIAGMISLVFGLFFRSRRWFRGKAENTFFWRKVRLFPKLYLKDVHDVVASKPFVARMHAFVAGGFIATILLTFIVHWGLWGGAIPVWSLLFFLAIMGIGAVMVTMRRIQKSASLSAGAFSYLPVALLSYVLGLAYLTLPLTGITTDYLPANLIAFLLFSYGVFFLISGMAFGPMKHAVMGALHLINHTRPERFEKGATSSALKRLPLSDEKLGVEKAEDFKWNQLLSFDACVQCGRCEDACPAYAAGQPLNPKKLIQDLAVASSLTFSSTESYAGSPYPGKENFIGQGNYKSKIIGDDAMVPGDTIWACTTCRACVQECPMMIEHVDAVIDIRRFQTLEVGATPEGAVKILEDLQSTDNTLGKAPDRRMDWAADLNLPLFEKVKKADVLLWLGEGVFELRNQKTLRAIVKLLQIAEVNFAVLGNEELDTGDTARRLGDEAVFMSFVERNITLLNKYQFKKILTTDPHVLNSLRNEYKEFGLQVEVVHHTSFLNDLIVAGKLHVSRGDEDIITYHDPCYLGRYNGEYSAPREILTSLGYNLMEMARSGAKSRCCGGGGGAPLSDIEGETRIPDIRMADVLETNSLAVAVACPNCMNMLEGVVAPRPQVTDIAELLLQNVEKSIEERGGN